MSEITIYGKLVGNNKPLTDATLVEGIEDFPARDVAEEGSVLGLDLSKKLVWTKVSSEGDVSSGIPIIEYTANNSTCIVSPDTKTYITCEGNANIELELIKDDGYAHSFLIVLLTVDALYTVNFPAYVEWLKPLVIEEYTKYFIIIEDNVAMYTSVKVLGD